MLLRLIQSFFLIVGTSIGAGILALPISTATCGFWGSVLALIIVWLFMTFAASNMIKARLCFEGEVDLATMTTALLGKTTNFFAECCYFALLMALVSLYITVGSAWVVDLAGHYLGFKLSSIASQISFTFVIASIIYSGLGNLANVNQFITMAKLFFMLMIIIISLPHIQEAKLATYSLNQIPHTFSLLLTTFGFSIILPSLVGYLHNDRKKMTIALIAGSIVILLAYLAWELITFGVIGANDNGLIKIALSKDKGTEVINRLATLVNDPAFTKYGFGIMLTAVLTSFLGVGQCLFSYLKDTLPIKNHHRKSLTAIFLGFVTPVVMINIYPTGISSILSFAGIFVAAILGIIPNAMMLSKEYNKRMPPNSLTQKILAVLSLIFFSGIILTEAWRVLW
jgi:tyrosine-specific transport protein